MATDPELRAAITEVLREVLPQAMNAEGHRSYAYGFGDRPELVADSFGRPTPTRADQLVDLIQTQVAQLRILAASLAGGGVPEAITAVANRLDAGIAGEHRQTRDRLGGATVGTKTTLDCAACGGVIDADAVVYVEGKPYHQAHAEDAPRVASDRQPPP